MGVGASAGGLEALTDLLRHLPADTGMAFVLVQHLDPTRESALVELLSKATTLPVQEVRNRMLLEPNHVYVIPPSAKMRVAQGVLKVVRSRRKPGAQHSIDEFLESLAQDRGARAIGVILSGAASDGTLGLAAIKAEGGITFAQDASAKYESMPRSAIDSRCVDFVLSPAQIAWELKRIARHPRLFLPEAELSGDSAPERGDYRKVLHLLRMRCGVDFRLYKPATLQRRITRRMVLNKVPRLSAYLKYLEAHPQEIDALFQDALITVTGFFRDPEVFERLKQRVFPALLRNRSLNPPVRVWVAGCSSGQEVYSVAMAFQEFAAQAVTQIPLQIFGTDLNEALLEKARSGFYSKGEVRDVSAERLRQFFIEQEGGFQICKSIREQCAFARQDLLSDPPFSRMDLVSCRNLLIYLQPVLQERLLAFFHYALKPSGFLLLGKSESIGEATGLFAVEDPSAKLYSKIRSATAQAVRLLPKVSPKAAGAEPARPLSAEVSGALEAQREADRLLLAQYAPAGVLVNEALEVVQFRGHTGLYLEHPPGRASYSFPKMLREGLLLPIRAALQKAGKTAAPARVESVEFQFDSQTRRASIEVVPLKNLKERWFLVLFEPAREPGSSRHPAEAVSAVPPALPRDLKASRRENVRLRGELTAAREYLQSVTERYEAANEELRVANEEGQSNNEELQSLNEEMETAKEELQSTNEELLTVNEELDKRNVELNLINSDLHNVLNSVELCIVVLGRDLSIRRFTRPAEKLLNLAPTDVGRPIGQMRPHFDFPALEAVLEEVMDTVRPHQREIQDRDGRWYAMSIRPYKTLDNRIDGVLLVLADTDALKRSEQRIQAALDYAEAMIETVREPLLVLNSQLQIQRANHSFYQVFHVSAAQSEGRRIQEIGAGQWRIPRLLTLLEEVLTGNTPFHDFEVEHEFEHLGHRTMLLNARPIQGDAGRPRLILLAIEDITERKQLLERVNERSARLRELVQELEAFSYSVSHDLRSPLRAMLGYANLALEQGGEQLNSEVKDYLQRVISAAARADRLVQDVLNYSRISRANFRLAPVDLEKLVREVIEQSPQFQAPQARIELQSPLLAVRAQETSLAQCVTNFLSNAIKFVAPGTTPVIRIRTEEVPGPGPRPAPETARKEMAEPSSSALHAASKMVRIWFEDNGIGIEPANQSRIFNIFERVHSAQQYEGTGIGLAIVRKNIERMRGSVGVESEPGNGSRFWIQLPAAESHERT